MRLAANLLRRHRRHPDPGHGLLALIIAFFLGYKWGKTREKEKGRGCRCRCSCACSCDCCGGSKGHGHGKGDGDCCQ